ncbi:Hsp20/alpha crystallin family protein [[Eubacterium] cellulosolvens]
MSEREKVTGKRKGAVSPPHKGTLSTRTQTSGLSAGFNNIFDQFRSAFDDLIAPFMPLTPSLIPSTELSIRYPFVDLLDKGDHFSLKAELPGFNKEMVDITANKDCLELKAENKQEKEEKREDYLHQERVYSSFQRYITFPEEVDPQKIEGSMKDGILELKIPKREPKPEEKMTKISLK